MRFAPGFPIKALSVGGHGCTIDIDPNPSGEGQRVTITPHETSLTKYARTEGEALDDVAAELDRMAASVRALKGHIEKRHQ